jgi:hypothetical protein
MTKEDEWELIELRREVKEVLESRDISRVDALYAKLERIIKLEQKMPAFKAEVDRRRALGLDGIAAEEDLA